MKTANELKDQLYKINHKPYGMYKQLSGGYDFGTYELWIDHVQGDPFAAPSRLRIVIPAARHGFPAHFIEEKVQKIALEDFVLRQFGAALYQMEEKRMGSGKSGNLTTCRTGQEMLERIAILFGTQALEARFEVGFPARGRTILAEELSTILFEILPKAAEQSLYMKAMKKDRLYAQLTLAENQAAIREELENRHLVCFVANGSILPRESGISQKPLKQAVPFQSPKSLEISLELPDGETIRGMAVPEGITVIAGGGYHGKSTLLKAIEAGVYNHIPGDGREYVITRSDALKLRAEDGRYVGDCNISPFINHLPNGQNTVSFSTENASGSTSQAANVIEALEAGSRLFLIDEDTTATNFMVRDALMSRLVSDDQEPITPFIRKIRSLSRDQKVSTIIVVGSSGEYLAAADLVLQLDEYRVINVTEKAEKLCQTAGIVMADQPFPALSFERPFTGMIPKDKYNDYKIKTAGTDSLTINYETMDVRYLEQLADPGQTIGLGLCLREILLHSMNGKKSKQQLVEDVFEKIEKQGLLSIVPMGYSCGQPVLPRRQELFFCLNRWRKNLKKREKNH